jgi:signal transduction histidine kinase
MERHNKILPALILATFFFILFWITLIILSFGGNIIFQSPFLLPVLHIFMFIFLIILILTYLKYFRRWIKNHKEETEYHLKEIKQLHNQLEEKNQLYNEMQTAKEASEENERLKMHFLANMSHEIRTPMNGIIGFAQMMQKNDIPDAKRIFYSKIIFDSGNKLLRIIDDLIDISKIESDQLIFTSDEIDLSQFLKDLFLQYKEEVEKKQLEFILINDLPKQESIIIGDEQKLKQIFNYLMQNAIYYTHKGKISIGAELKGENLQFYVADTGVGIQEKKHAIIFERFKQSNSAINKLSGGTGLGLAISKGILKKMNGDISVESSADKGARFTFHIPFVQAKQLPKTSNIPFSIKRKSLKGITILIAENNQSNYFRLSDALDIYGPTLLHALNGLEALDFVIKNNAIDIVLMDTQLPIMDGLEAAREIKKIQPKLPIIAQTDFVSEQINEKLQKSGFDAVLVKPLNPEDLLKAIHQYL